MTPPKPSTSRSSTDHPSKTSPSAATAGPDEGAVEPDTDPGAIGPGATHAVIEGEVAPRLPHERDQSSDSGTRAPSERMKQAGRELEAGQTDETRGPEAQQHYSDLTARAGSGGQTTPASAGAQPSGRGRKPPAAQGR